MKFKRIFAAILCAALSVLPLAAFAGCADGQPPEESGEIKGEFLSLQQAYDNGFLTVEDLQNLAKSEPERSALSAKKELAIRQTLYDDLYENEIMIWKEI